MLVKHIQKRLWEQANASIAEHSQGFFKTGIGEYGEGDRFMGIRVPVLRKMIKEFKGLGLDEIAEVLHSEWHEQRLLALLLLVDLYSRSEERDKKDIFSFYLDSTYWINNWDLVDTTCTHIVGNWLHSRSRSILYKLIKSEVVWERRIAIIASFYFIKREDFTDTLMLSERLLNDTHDLMHKAVGWMLREVGKRDIQMEEAFLKKHYEVMPRTMLRYAIEKFPENRRKAYLQGTV